MSHLVLMLPVSSMPASVAFYQKLGFEIERRNDEWRWAMLRFGESLLMLDESIHRHPGSPRDAVLYLYLDDIVEYHARLRQRGMTVPDLEITFYDMTEFRIDDPEGNRLWIGQGRKTGPEGESTRRES